MEIKIQCSLFALVFITMMTAQPPGPGSRPPSRQCGPQAKASFKPLTAETCIGGYPRRKIASYLKKNPTFSRGIKKSGKGPVCRLQRSQGLGPSGPGRCRARRSFYTFPKCEIYRGKICFVLHPWSNIKCSYIRCLQQSCRRKFPPANTLSSCVHRNHQRIVYYILCFRPFIRVVQRSIRLPQSCRCESWGPRC